jgi:DNA-binding MarR family transcriptional regulator
MKMFLEAEAPMLTASDETLLTPWICLIARMSTRYVGGKMSRMGFGPGQFFLLSELFAEEGLSQDELSRRVGVDKSNISRALAKLERYGLVERKSDPQNHRVKKVFLKPNAHIIRNKIREIQGQWNNELLNGLTKKEKAALFSGLRRIAENAEAALDQPYIQAAKCRIA